MKIVLLTTGLGVGGAERQVCDLADSFQEFGHEVMIVYMTGEALVKPRSVSVILKKIRINKNIFSFVKWFFSFVKTVNEFKPDVIHSHMVHANIMARLASIFVDKNIKVISTAHSTNEGGRLRMLAYRLTDHLADISTNVSQEAVDVFIKKKAAPEGRMIVMHNGIDTNKFRPAEDSKLTFEVDKIKEKKFLAVGRLVEAKDYPNLLHAFDIISKENNVRLIIVGDGPLRENLFNLCENLGIKDKVDFLGVRNDIPVLMNMADYFVLSSAWEGFGLVVAEAMATEKIVIATNCGGVAEVVGEAGLIVPPKNYRKLAEAMQYALMLGESEAKTLRIKARERVVKNFSLNTVSAKWLDIYKKI